MSFIPVTCAPVIGTVIVDGGTVTVIPSGGFTPVAGSRWFDTDSDDLSLLGVTDLTLTSPVPGAGEIVVVDFLSYFTEILVGVALTALDVQVRQVSDSTIIWQSDIGFTAAAGLGSLVNFEQTGLYVFGEPGEQLEMVITVNAGLGVTVATSANFGGFIATA